MTGNLLKASFIILCSLLVVACDQALEKHKPLVSAPTFLETYEREPFGNQQFHAFVQMMGPLWDNLKEDHPDLKLFRYVVPSELSELKATAELEKNLGGHWNVDSAYTQQSHWGWSRGFRNGDYVFVFLTINPDHADDPTLPSLLPAAILTDTVVISKLAPLTRHPDRLRSGLTAPN
jgi:hypothetical protein